MENETLKDAEAKVSAAKEALILANSELDAARIAAIAAVDVNDLAACLALKEALKDAAMQSRLTGKVGRHHLPFIFEGKIFALPSAAWKVKTAVAYIATRIRYNLSANGVHAWVDFVAATKSWEKNEAVKYGNPSLNYPEMPIERTRSDFEWNQSQRAWILKAESEVQHG